ncbi:MAG: VPS10 domain-containing protein [Armatimonadota bacterium]
MLCACSPRRSSRAVLLLLALAATLGAGAVAQEEADSAYDPFRQLVFRNIGPGAMGGRIDDFAVDESNPSTFYVATAASGLWKTENHGTTFRPIFDRELVSSIGDVTLAPSDPSIVYVGTGEPNNRQSSSWGHGVYRSSDAGRTWTHLGLEDTHHIGRIVVHPTDPETVYVAALGHLWGPNKERGLYKSTDGGKSWKNTKLIDADTGFVDVAIDPRSPNTLYAASYQRRRTAFGFNGGGPGSGLWKTTDGGATWRKLTNGLPTQGDVGRIGVNLYRKDPSILYCTVEHQAQGGTYRSDDRGESWRKVSDTNPRPSYYSKIHVDPNNDQRVWLLGAPLYLSEDGGKSWLNDRYRRIHVDFHALWVNPANSNHVLAGSDGGIHISYDQGRNWDYVNTLALAQFYEVSADNRKPYWVYGGLQDNGTWAGPSRTLWTEGITNDDWEVIGGGDGFHTVVDPSDHHVVYLESQDGNLRRLDQRTGQARIIRPEPPDDEKYRFNWNSPILLSPHDSKTVYYGGNRVFGSRDRGETWTLVSPDLTRGEKRDELTIFGKKAKEMLSRNDGVVHWGTVTTLAESPVRAGVLWAGTDDGNLQVSRDGGATWENVVSRVPGLPKGTYVSRVEASRTGDGAAYVAFDGHRSDDFHAYLYRTDDFGKSWKSVRGNLPEGGTVSVVREHPRNPDVLFAGTERGLWVSWNRGGQWHAVRSNLPTVPVDDIQIHPRENDLILGTHGRGIWILDDIEPISALTPKVREAELHLFDMRPAAMYRLTSRKGSTGDKLFEAPNLPVGALVQYHLKKAVPRATPVRVTVKDAAGRVVRELPGSGAAGVNRVLWDLRGTAPARPGRSAAAGTARQGGGRGVWVDPGTYTVTVTAGDQSASGPVVVEEDPRLEITPAERAAWRQALDEAGKLWVRAGMAGDAVRTLHTRLTELKTSLARREGTPKEVLDTVNSLQERVAKLNEQMFGLPTPLGFAGAPLADEPDPISSRASRPYFLFGSYTAPPTPQQRAQMERAARELGAFVVTLNGIIEKEIPALNRLMFDHGIARLENESPVS